MKPAFRYLGAALLATMTLWLTTSTAPAQIEPGSALEFDGVDDYVSVEDTPVLDLTTNLTFEAWVKFRQVTRDDYAKEWQCLVTKNHYNASYALMLYTGVARPGTPANTLRFYHRGASPEETSYSWTDVTSNQWYHVAATFGNGAAKVYINGELTVSNSVSGSINVTNLPLWLGRESPSGYPFDGQMDEVRIWNVARTGEHIQANMYHPLTGTETNLVAYWALNEGAGTTAYDDTSNHLDGTLHNGPVWMRTQVPTFSTALEFDGGPNHVHVPAGVVLSDRSFSMEFWAKRANASGGDQWIMAQGMNDLNRGLHIGFRNNRMLFAFYANDLHATNDIITDLLWHHWSLTYNATNNVRKIYRDGVLIANDVAEGHYQGSGPLFLGRRYDGVSFFEGSLQDIRVWDVPRSPAQIQANMDQRLTGTEPGLVAYWALNEGLGSTAGESTINQLHGTLTNCPVWMSVQGRTFGAALSFDGVDDYVDVVDDVYFSGDLTIESWVFPRAFTEWARVLDFGNGQSADNVLLAFSYKSTGRPSFDVRHGGTLQGSVTSPGPLPLDQWSHLAVTLGGTTATLYVDGFPVATNTIQPPQNVMRTSNKIADSNWPESNANVILDELRIWNVARSAEHIQANMVHPLTGTEPNLVAYYRFDEGTCTDTYDATTNHLDGTLINGPVWTNSTIPEFIGINAGLQGVENGSVAWGDYDNDGRLDILLTGYGGGRRTEVWRNNGDGTFSDIHAGLPGVGYLNNVGSVAWGDYDNDGWLDILLTGEIDFYTQISKIYRNNGDDTFSDSGIPLTGVRRSSVAWGDYDNDGWLDILLTGQPGDGSVSKIYRNNGDGTFSDSGIPLTGVQYSSVAWGDYDNDGWLDILLTGEIDQYTQISKIYRNNGDDTFSDSGIPLTGVRHSSVAWGDYDNDGWLDILLTGQPGSGSVSKIYRNNGDGTFSDSGIPLTGVRIGGVAWGDYDNDGFLDILMSGFVGGDTRVSKIYRNRGDGTFTDSDIQLLGLQNASAAWGDYDNDRRLDILLTGRLDSGDDTAQVWRNIGRVANTLPSPPVGLAATVVGRTATLNWSAASDGETPSNGLTYSLRVGTTPGAIDVISAHSASDGLRRVAAMGSAQHGLTALLTKLSDGTYHWSVQAVDSAFAGSPFAVEGSFVVMPPVVDTLQATDITSTSVKLQGTVDPRDNETFAWFEYGLTTKYGNMTSATNVGSGPGPMPISSPISGLLPWMTYHCRAVASNELGRTDGPDMTFTLLGPFGVGTEPSLSALPDVTIPQGGNTMFSFTASPEDLDVRVRCNNPVLLPDTGIGLTSLNPTHWLNLVPDPNQSGAAQITVTASDGMRAASDTFTLTVTPWTTDPAQMLWLEGAHVVTNEAWRFHVVDLGTASTNYAVQYQSALSPTNNWILATNVTDLGGDLYEVDTGPPQGDTGFYRVKGFRGMSAGFNASGSSGDEGEVIGPVIQFNGIYTGTINYSWTDLSGLTQTGTVQVAGTTAVIPLPVTDNADIDQLQYLTLRLEDGTGYALGTTAASTVTIEENDAAWQGTLLIANGLADTTTALLTNSSGGGYTTVTLPQNANMAIGFTLTIQETNGNFQGQIQSDGYGFFPTNALAQLTLTTNRFVAVATAVGLPSLTGSPLLSGPHSIDVRLDADNTQTNESVSPTQITGVATLVSAVPGRPYLDSALSGTFLLLKPATAPSTNDVPLYPAP